MRVAIAEDPRVEFQILNERLSNRYNLVMLERAKAKKEFEKSLYVACRVRGIPWPNSDPIRVLKTKHPNIYQPLFEKAREGAITFDEAYKREGVLLKQRVEALAQICPIDATSEFLSLYHQATEYDYATQTNPLRYAEVRVLQESWVIGYNKPEIRCEIQRIEKGYGLYVGLSPFDTIVLKAQLAYMGFPMREYVRRTWATGCNPRVFNPFLPWDLEMKLGITQMGADTRYEYYACGRCNRKFKNTGAPMISCICGFDLSPKPD